MCVFQCKMTIKDVSAATMYDVLHDGSYRKEWDPAMRDSFDIARLSANADVGYYSCEDSLSALITLLCVLCPSKSHPPETRPVSPVTHRNSKH